MRINHNIAALNTHRQLSAANNANQNSMEKLSSGLRINKAGDDAAGLAISEKMRGQIRGLEQANRNAQDGISMIQTAEGAMNETHSILQRMRELSVQASNDTNTGEDRAELQKEVDQLTEEIDRIGNNTEFNTQNLLDGNIGNTAEVDASATSNIDSIKVNGEVNEGDAAYTIAETVNYEDEITTGDGPLKSAEFEVFESDGSTPIGTVSFSAEDFEKGNLSKTVEGSNGEEFTIEANADLLGTTGNGDGTQTGTDDINVDKNNVSFQIGANASQTMDLSVNDMRSEALGVDGIDLTSKESANQAIGQINNAIESVSSERSKLGATQNRLEHTINNLGTTSENLTASESRIRDVDMAKEMMNQTKQNILAQASQSMLAKANQQPQGVLQLLR